MFGLIRFEHTEYMGVVSVKCCKKIDDDWIDGDMWHDNHTTFGCSHGKLLVIYRCPHCDEQTERDFVEVTTNGTTN